MQKVKPKKKKGFFDKDSAEFHTELFRGEDAIIAGIKKIVAKGKVAGAKK